LHLFLYTEFLYNMQICAWNAVTVPLASQFSANHYSLLAAHTASRLVVQLGCRHAILHDVLGKGPIVFLNCYSAIQPQVPNNLSVQCSFTCHPPASLEFLWTNALNSNLPHWPTTLSTPLSLFSSAPFLLNTPLHVRNALPTTICCRFRRPAKTLLCFMRLQHCCPFSMELAPFWHSCLFLITYILSPSKNPLLRAPPSPQRLTQVPQIWPLADTMHYSGFYLLTYSLTKSCNKFVNLWW